MSKLMEYGRSIEQGMMQRLLVAYMKKYENDRDNVTNIGTDLMGTLTLELF